MFTCVAERACLWSSKAQAKMYTHKWIGHRTLMDCPFTYHAQMEIQGHIDAVSHYYSLGPWTGQWKISSSASLSQQLREAKPYQANIAGKVVCSQVRGPSLSEAVCRQSGRCRSFSGGPNHCGRTSLITTRVAQFQWGGLFSLGLGSLQCY